jgi:hypothetical protein
MKYRSASFGMPCGRLEIQKLLKKCKGSGHKRPAARGRHALYLSIFSEVLNF